VREALCKEGSSAKGGVAQFLAEVEARERRRSLRVMLQIPVLIQVPLPEGRNLRHDGFTLVVNAHGCVFTMETKLEVGQRILLVNPKSRMEQSGIVTRVQKSRDGGYAVAFEFDNSTPQLWSLMFLSKDAKVERF
jgi:PilZ domain